jgi:hypothetical protein
VHNIFAGFDWQTFSRLMSHAGIDPRHWVSIGIVDVDTPQNRSVRFSDQDGPLPQPLVNVTMQPSGLPVSARVLQGVSGAGVGQWHPFVGGDEVLLLIPGGDEGLGAVIVGRLSNSIDKFPTNVAGNDTTQNSLGFMRFSEPFVMESGTSLTFRVSSHGAFISLDPVGGITATSGSGHYLAIQDDLVSLQTKDTSCMVQIDPSAQTVFLQASDTQLLLQPTSSGASHFLGPGTLSLITMGGGYAPGHAVTLEQVTVLLWALATGIGALLVPTLTPPEVVALVNVALAAAAAGPVAPFVSAINTGLSTPPDPSGATPGVGRAGLLF